MISHYNTYISIEMLLGQKNPFPLFSLVQWHYIALMSMLASKTGSVGSVGSDLFIVEISEG